MLLDCRYYRYHKPKDKLFKFKEITGVTKVFKKIQFSAVLTAVLLLASFIPVVYRYIFNFGEAIVVGFSQEMPVEVVRIFFVSLTLFLFFISRTHLSRIVWGVVSTFFLLGLFAWLTGGLNNGITSPEFAISSLLSGLVLGITEYFSNRRNRIGRFVK